MSELAPFLKITGKWDKMKLRPDQQRVKTLISDTITLLCKNGLIYNNEFCVEAVIGITLDKNQVFLVNINETVTKGNKHKPNHNGSAFKHRKRRASDENCIQNGVHSMEDSVSARKSPKMPSLEPPQLHLGHLASTHNNSQSPVRGVGHESESNEAFDLSYRDASSVSPTPVHVIRPDPEEENSHSHLVPDLKERLEENENSDEAVDQAEVSKFEAIGAGPPVWPGLEPSLTFPAALETEGGAADLSATSHGDHSQDWAVLSGESGGSERLNSSAAAVSPPTSEAASPSAAASAQKQPIPLVDGKSACPDCGKIFRENWMVRRHMLTHGEAAVACPLCNKRFKRKDTLKAHVDSKHPGHVYETLMGITPKSGYGSKLKSTAVAAGTTTPTKSEPFSSPSKAAANSSSAKKKSGKKGGKPSRQPPPQQPVWPGFDPTAAAPAAHTAMTIEEFEGTNGRVEEEDGDANESGSALYDVSLAQLASAAGLRAGSDEEAADGNEGETSVVEGLELVDEAPATA